MQTMNAMVLIAPNQPLQLRQVEVPTPNEHQVLIKVIACGICRTDLHIVDGELSEPCLPLIPGHQIVGKIVATGDKVNTLSQGMTIGMPWLGNACGDCEFCQNHQENLCDEARYTGYQFNGGFAEFCVADSRYCFPIPAIYPPIQAAPLLCAGLIGYRSYQKAGKGECLGFYGFGAAAHILTQLAVFDKRKVYAFTKVGDAKGQEFARSLGAVWAGDSTQAPPLALDAAIIFAPDGSLVPQALKHTKKGGRVVCAGIHMSDIPSFPYVDLWGERRIESVANLTRKDGEEFLKIAPQVPVQTTVSEYSLEQTNQALEDLRDGGFEGAAVITL